MKVRVSSDRAIWGIEIAAWDQEFFEIHLWRDLLDAPEQQDEVLSFTRQAAYLMSRIDRIDELVPTALSRARYPGDSKIWRSIDSNGGFLEPT